MKIQFPARGAKFPLVKVTITEKNHTECRTYDDSTSAIEVADDVTEVTVAPCNVRGEADPHFTPIVLTGTPAPKPEPEKEPEPPKAEKPKWSPKPKADKVESSGWGQ